MRPLFARLLLACLVLWSCLGFAGEPQWVELRSPHFSVLTDAGEKRGRDVALHFEQMRSVFGALMTKANVNVTVPLQIVAFRNTKEMRQVAPMFNGKPTQLDGLFQGGQDRSFIMLDMSVEDPWSVVFHEYAHQLLDANTSARADPWFEEGFAEYFSSIEVDNKEARVGKIPVDTYLILNQLGMMKVADLFRVQQYSKTYNESGDHRTTFYAQSGLVVHYLYDNALIQKLGAYFDAVQGQKKPVEEGIQTAFGMSAEQFDQALRKYLNSRTYRYSPIPTPAGILTAQFTATPVSLAEARAVLADIHAHSLDYKDQALTEFQDVLKMEPNNASALRGAGYAYLQKQDLGNAAEYFRRAAAQNSKDPRVHFYYAMVLNQEGAPDEARWAEIIKELQAAIALDPNYAEAYSLLGYTQAVSGAPGQGIETTKKAIALAPRNEHYYFNLANIYMANRKPELAIAIFQKLSGSPDQAIALRAGEAMAQAENLKAQAQTFVLQVENQNSQSASGSKDAPGPAGSGQPASNQAVSSQRVEASIPPAVHFLKGKLVSVDCAASPQAVLTLSAGAKSVKLHVRDSGRVIVIGAEQFSCDWKNKSVAVNYRERPDGDGDVVSLEVQ